MYHLQASRHNDMRLQESPMMHPAVERFSPSLRGGADASIGRWDDVDDAWRIYYICMNVTVYEVLL